MYEPLLVLLGEKYLNLISYLILDYGFPVLFIQVNLPLMNSKNCSFFNYSGLEVLEVLMCRKCFCSKTLETGIALSYTHLQ